MQASGQIAIYYAFGKLMRAYVPCDAQHYSYLSQVDVVSVLRG
jgi:hypothetical protein